MNGEYEIMELPSKNSHTVNTDLPVKNDGIPRLPNDRDESPDSQTVKPRNKMKQAYADLQRGLVDTDLHGERGIDAVTNPVPFPISSKDEKKKSG